MSRESNRKRSGFKDTTRLASARERLHEAVSSHGRTETVPLADVAEAHGASAAHRAQRDGADGRALAETVAAARNVPHYARAAMDGYAVRAKDTFGASGRSPEVLERSEEPGPGRAVRVHTGSELPDGADAVVMIEQVEELGPELEVFDAVAEGENVGPVGEDVEEGQTLYEPGHRVRPSDLGLLKSVGLTEVEVYERPRVAVIPTGEEVVQSDPAPGEVIETNATTISRYVRRWGGAPVKNDVVTDDEDLLREAVGSNLDADAIVTTGGSSVGERDLMPEVVDSLGEVLVHGVALKPGHPVAFGEVEGTPVIMLPGYPVACIINAVQFLRPALKWSGDLPYDDMPTREARLARKIRSEPGVVTFARVKLDETEDGEVPEGPRRGGETAGSGVGLEATPTRASGSGILSSVALADGWVAVPESSEGIPEGETVEVQDWEWSA